MKNRFRRLTKRRSRDPASDTQFIYRPRIPFRSIVLRLSTFIDVYEYIVYIIFIRHEHIRRGGPPKSRVNLECAANHPRRFDVKNKKKRSETRERKIRRGGAGRGGDIRRDNKNPLLTYIYV